MKKRLVILVYDHRNRDLAGIKEIGNELLKKGYEPWVVQWNYLELNYWWILARVRPISILIHNCRKTYGPIVRLAERFGIRIFAYDVEGAPYWDEVLVNGINRGVSNRIARYFAWGHRQAELLVERGIFDNKKIQVVGAVTMSGSQRKIYTREGRIGKSVLVLTNFAQYAPRYKNRVDENRGLYRVVRDQSVVDSWVKGCQLNRDLYLDMIHRLAGYGYSVTVRVHPFEDRDIYLALASQTGGIEISGKDEIVEDLCESDLVVVPPSTTFINCLSVGIMPVIIHACTTLPAWLTGVEDVYDLSGVNSADDAVKRIEVAWFKRESTDRQKIDRVYKCLELSFGDFGHSAASSISQSLHREISSTRGQPNSTEMYSLVVALCFTVFRRLVYQLKSLVLHGSMYGKLLQSGKVNSKEEMLFKLHF